MKDRLIEYVSTWEKRCYPDGIPDEVPCEISHKVPDYKKICSTILKNDVALKTLGFDSIKCDAYKELKRIEIEKRLTNNLKDESI